MEFWVRQEERPSSTPRLPYSIAPFLSHAGVAEQGCARFVNEFRLVQFQSPAPFDGGAGVRAAFDPVKVAVRVRVPCVSPLTRMPKPSRRTAAIRPLPGASPGRVSIFNAG